MKLKDILEMDSMMVEAVGIERDRRREIRAHLLEIDCRKLWRQKGYSSLYNYCELYLKLPPDEVDEILEDDTGDY